MWLRDDFSRQNWHDRNYNNLHCLQLLVGTRLDLIWCRWLPFFSTFLIKNSSCPFESVEFQILKRMNRHWQMVNYYLKLQKISQKCACIQNQLREGNHLNTLYMDSDQDKTLTSLTIEFSSPSKATTPDMVADHSMDHYRETEKIWKKNMYAPDAIYLWFNLHPHTNRTATITLSVLMYRSCNALTFESVTSLIH